MLDTLFREQSLTRAAEAMDMTQPALSKTLARLREHFGDQLFVRVAFEMKPTTKALQLAPQIRSILKELSLLQCEQIPFVPETSTRNFNFAGPDAAVVLFLPPILKYIKEHAPDVRLSAVQLDMEHLHDWLESGQVDLTAGSFPHLVQGIKRQRLFSFNYLSLVRKGHPRLAGLPSLNAFIEEQHVVVAAVGAGHHTQIAQQILESVVPKEKISAYVPGFAAAALLAKHIGAVVTMPTAIGFVLARELDLDILQPPVKLPDTDIYQYWHERYDRDPGHEWLRALFHDQCSRIVTV
ncbi:MULTISPECIES: LysR family transcriptional regulator [unclassified Bradyrhizobium]